MALMNAIAGVLQRYANGEPAASTEEAHAHYDQIAAHVPQSQLAGAIGPALSTLGGSGLREKIAASVPQMTSDQRSSIVETLLAGLGPNATAVLSHLGLNPAIATAPAQASPSDVGALAHHAEQNNPDLFNRAMQVYAQHPMLVKTLGTLAIARIAQQLNRQP